MKKVLLVDTNFSSKPIYEYILNLGFQVFVVGNKPDDYLAKITENYIQMDYSNEEALFDYVLSIGFDYVVPGGNDVSYKVCSWVNSKKKFFNIDSPEVNAIINNKYQFRHYATTLNLSIPKLYDEKTAKKSFPVIVKPVDAYSGRGTTVVNSNKTKFLHNAILQAKKFSRNGNYLIEKFVEGQLYSYSAFISGNVILQDFVVKEFCNMNPFVVDTSFVDYSFDINVLENIKNQVLSIVKDLMLSDGLIHTQFIMEDGEFWIIEITRRSPGDLYGKLIEYSTGFPYAEYYVNPFLNIKNYPYNRKLQTNNILRHTLSLGNSGVFNDLSFTESTNVKQFIPLALPGDRIKPSPFGRAGVLFLNYSRKKNLDLGVKKIINNSLYTISNN